MRSFYRRIGSVQVRSAFVRPLGGVHVPTTEIRRIVLPLSSSPLKKKNKKRRKKDRESERCITLFYRESRNLIRVYAVENKRREN